LFSLKQNKLISYCAKELGLLKILWKLLWFGSRVIDCDSSRDIRYKMWLESSLPNIVSQRDSIRIKSSQVFDTSHAVIVSKVKAITDKDENVLFLHVSLIVKKSPLEN